MGALIVQLEYRCTHRDEKDQSSRLRWEWQRQGGLMQIFPRRPPNRKVTGYPFLFVTLNTIKTSPFLSSYSSNVFYQLKKRVAVCSIFGRYSNRLFHPGRNLRLCARTRFESISCAENVVPAKVPVGGTLPSFWTVD